MQETNQKFKTRIQIKDKCFKLELTTKRSFKTRNQITKTQTNNLEHSRLHIRRWSLMSSDFKTERFVNPSPKASFSSSINGKTRSSIFFLHPLLFPWLLTQHEVPRSQRPNRFPWTQSCTNILKKQKKTQHYHKKKKNNWICKWMRLISPSGPTMGQ